VMLAPQPGQVPQTHQAIITDVSYFGDHVRLRCRLFGRDDFGVKLANLAAASGVEVGQQVILGWLPEDCRALVT
jgi:putative spermidine/putrescine transport system ATP-binding protein